MQFTKDELQLIINLCDIACRAQGINIAQMALPLAQKCQEALNQPDEPKKPELVKETANGN